MPGLTLPMRTTTSGFRLLLALLVAALAAGGCAQRRAAGPVPGPSDSAPAAEVTRSAPGGDGAAGDAPAAAAERKLVQTVEMTIEVADPEAAAEVVEEAAEAGGGFVERLDLQRRGELPWISMTLRVPAASLEEVLEAIRTVATRVERQSMAVEDVTARYVDLDARVRTLRRAEEELEALLGESRSRGAKAEEILAVYREVTQIRSQRESLEGQLRALSRQVDLSTIQLRLTPQASAQPLTGTPWRPGETFHDAVRSLLTALRGFADVAIYAVVVLLPVLLLLALPVWALYRLARWRRGRRSRMPPTDRAALETAPAGSSRSSSPNPPRE